MVSQRVPGIELLVTFLAVYRTRNFSHAAQRLHLTQSAVSHRIRRLEDETGIVLFERSPHNVVATSAASALALAIDPALEMLERAFSQLRSGVSDPLEIEVEPAFSTRWLAPRLKGFLKDHPALKLQINLSDKQLEFSGQTEVAIKWGKAVNWPDYHCETLIGLTFTPMCAPGFMERNGLVSLPDLLKCVLLHDRDYGGWMAFARQLGLPSQHFQTGHIIRDTPLLEQAAIEGDGIALYAIELAQAALRRGELITPFAGATLVGADAYLLLTEPGRQRSSAGEAFLHWIRQVAEAEETGPDTALYRQIANPH